MSLCKDCKFHGKGKLVCQMRHLRFIHKNGCWDYLAAVEDKSIGPFTMAAFNTVMLNDLNERINATYKALHPEA